MKAILFDLDETLILDEAVSHEAFRAAAALAEPLGLKSAALAESAGRIARKLWQAGPAYEYCLRIGHSAWEGLWAEYDRGDHPLIAILREWAPGYQIAVWQQALAEVGGAPEASTGGGGALPAAMAARFKEARRSYPLYPEIPELLTSLKARGYKLGIVTNGVPDLQRRKLDGCGLLPLFDAAVASGEIDCGKPDPGIFHHICTQLGVQPAACVMVGDNPERDVAGAMAAGMAAVWVSRNGRPRDERFP
ncbi:MAG TPA: HAD family hydrolase, partial [Symbiobacteriaceae bacterium]|nr:HAD family hydrolase [Symbiobacteriaceae bacterium]